MMVEVVVTIATVMISLIRSVQIHCYYHNSRNDTSEDIAGKHSAAQNWRGRPLREQGTS
jgi:hypothetical protein